jgi:hypothetical protein
MAKKKQPATTTPVPTQPDPEATGGRPAAVHLDLDFTPRCPVCYGNARVKLTKTGGYFLQCGSCWLTLFTKSNHGHVIFRAQQDLLADERVSSLGSHRLHRKGSSAMWSGCSRGRRANRVPYGAVPKADQCCRALSPMANRPGSAVAITTAANAGSWRRLQNRNVRQPPPATAKLPPTDSGSSGADSQALAFWSEES